MNTFLVISLLFLVAIAAFRVGRRVGRMEVTEAVIGYFELIGAATEELAAKADALAEMSAADAEKLGQIRKASPWN